MLSLRFTDTSIFHKIVKTAFDKVDTNNDGRVDDNELTLALAMVHHKVARRAPGVSTPPTKKEIKDLMGTYDTEEKGTLTEEQFYKLARDWFEKKGATFIMRIVGSVLLSMIALPGAGGMIRNQIPFAKRLPKQLVTFVIGVVWKFASARMGGIGM